ncbi:MAG: hypothetical protein VKL59_18600 [Nostocaceae cyanobacterium]|nr:hypothetical protein [Nostocaceae cyanobacterium]
MTPTAQIHINLNQKLLNPKKTNTVILLKQTSIAARKSKITRRERQFVMIAVRGSWDIFEQGCRFYGSNSHKSQAEPRPSMQINGFIFE